MKNNNHKDYKVGFSGDTISKLEANRIGLSLIIGFCILFSVNSLFSIENKKLVFLVALFSVFFSYFAISKRVFKRNKHNKNIE